MSFLPKRSGVKLKFFISSILLLVIIAVMATNYFWTAHQQRQQALESLRQEAKLITAQFMALRTYIARNQDQINYDSSGNFEFKHLNPATVGKGVADLFTQESPYTIKQTRAVPRNPENTPDRFESEALRKFQLQSGLSEIFAPDTVDGQRVYRYILPMYTNESCLQCHGSPAGETDIAGYPKEGLQVGELAGALSITVPAERFYNSLWTQKVGYLTFTVLLVIATILILYLLLSWYVINPLGRLRALAIQVGEGNLDVSPSSVEAVGEIHDLAEEFGVMTEKLREFYRDLESKVQERTAELQKANVELTRAYRFQNEFLANMTHEIRTPLTSIISFTELLLDGVQGEITQEQRGALEDIKESAEQLLNLVNDLLDLTRIEAGQMRLSIESLDPVDVINSAIRSMLPLITDAGLSISKELPLELPMVMADPTRLRQVIINLLSNAVKFTPKEGHIQVGARVDLDYLVLWVSDTGIGIKPEDQEIIFEKFRQVDGSATRNYKGVGIGLAVSKHLMELQGGWISLESEPEKGSTFKIAIPISK